MLLLQRSLTGDFAGTWCCPGGKIEEGESPALAAVREFYEETNYRVGALDEPFATRIADDVHFTTFLAKCDDEFVPKLNEEHTAFAWVKPADALAGHSGLVPQPAASGTMQ